MKERVGAFFRRRHRLVLLVSGFTITVGALIDSSPLLAILVIVCGFGIGWVGDSLREHDDEDRESIRSRSEVLERENHEAIASLETMTISLAEAIEDWLEAIAVWTALDSEARVTLYSQCGTSWKRLARFSTNLSYKGSGRESLPVEQGALHRAHVVGEYFIDSLPSPESDAESYFAEHRRMGIKMSVCRQFNMHSRSYCCFAFGGSSDRGRPYVLVFESTDPNGLDSEALKRTLHAEAKHAIVDLAKLLRST